MRKLRTLIVLGLITLLAVLLAVLTARQESDGIAGSGERLFPKLLAQVNDVARIQGAGQGGPVTLVRTDLGWQVQEKGGYAAATAEVRALLLGLAQLKRLEPKTRNPERYAALGLEEVTTKDARSVQLVLQDSGGQSLASVLLGNRRPAKGASDASEIFVRLPEDPQAWLVEGRLPSNQSAKDWLDKEVLKLDQGRIRSLKLNHGDGQSVFVHKSERSAGDFQLADIPKGREVQSAYSVNSIATVFTDLTLEDVKPQSQIKFESSPPLKAELASFDGLRIVMETSKEGEQTYARFQARFAPAAEATSEAPARTEGKSAEEVKKESETLNARWKGWAYVLPEYRLSSLSQKQADLLKPVDQDKADKPAAE
jgi:hypothetical protein